jgi:ATP-dependent DNA ligase
VCKSRAESAYQAGARGWQWIKLKRDYRTELSDTVDLVVIGAFAGRGRRTGVYGAVLLAAYDADADMFRAVSKCGAGFTDAHLATLHARLAPLPPGQARPGRRPAGTRRVVRARARAGDPQRRAHPVPEQHRRLGPDRARQRAGHALPRFTGRWRDDKSPEDATTTRELIELFLGARHTSTAS